ncbi:SDR family NAD(P)-dependent oxidoreductase [Hyphococcus formosus]|uniref:SDR family NAD(P)-dependent oxidoreductase n=1 Tax=Hyphococcus formosus TaxID=3143534 RepID=UPI00398B7713
MSRFDGKSYFVTGAANGIGAAVCRKILSEGGAVSALDVDAAGLTALENEFGNEKFCGLVGSASDASDIDQSINAAIESFGAVDGAVCCAGLVGVSSPIHEYPLETFDQIMDVNVRGPFIAIQKLTPHLAKRGGGSIVLVSSINGIKGFATFGAYAASKQAVMGLMKTSSIDLASRNIRVNSVHPGVVNTNMMRDVETMVAPEDTQAAKSAFAAIAPMKRYADPSEIATSIAFLLSDEASYITGAGNIIDGGFTTGIAGA